MGYGKLNREKSRHGKQGVPLKAVLIAVSAVCCVALVVGLAVLLPGCTKDDANKGDTSTTSTTTTTQTTTTTKYEPPVYHISASSVFVRAAASIESEKIGSLFQGTEVDVVAIEGEWYHIRYKDLDGYVRNDCIELKSGVAGTTTKGESTTTTTTTQTTGTTSTQYDDRYIDDEGLLQFKAGDNYVQANAYPDGEIPWNLLLVNDWNPMPKGYDEALTFEKASPSNTSQPVDSRIKEDLEAMLEAGKAYNIGVQSAYRSSSKQSDLYWKKVNYYKGIYSDPVVIQTKAGEVVKRPGFSEHNTGLAVDLYGSGDYSLTESFAKTDAYKWLIENCADYGFILRFPKGKEAITGVIYEAWHFRYVGDKEIAHEIMDNGLCLEEYLAQTQQ